MIRSASAPALALAVVLALAGGCVVTIDASTSATASSGGPQTASSDGATSDGSTSDGSTSEGSGSASEATSTSTATDTTTDATTGTTDGTTDGETTTGGACECAADEYCDWAADGCGDLRGDVGACELRPDGCDDDYDPVCGCDGAVHSNACYARAAGVDFDPSGACLPPAGLVACGYRFCDPAVTYCRISTSDVFTEPTSYQCVPYPVGCGGTPSCACLVDEACAEFGCDEDGPLIEIVCPGG